MLHVSWNYEHLDVHVCTMLSKFVEAKFTSGMWRADRKLIKAYKKLLLKLVFSTKASYIWINECKWNYTSFGSVAFSESLQCAYISCRSTVKATDGNI